MSIKKGPDAQMVARAYQLLMLVIPNRERKVTRQVPCKRIAKSAIGLHQQFRLAYAWRSLHAGRAEFLHQFFNSTKMGVGRHPYHAIRAKRL